MGIAAADALTGRQALDLVYSLRRLGPWVLKPQVIALAAQEAARRGLALREDYQTPRREDVAGACVALFVKPQNSCASPLLRDCFGVPLVWRSQEHLHAPDCPPGAPSLPASLQRLAADVRKHILPRHSHACWGLWHRFSRQAMIALSDLMGCDTAGAASALPADSAFVPLAISLQLVRQGGNFDCVWATGCFDQYRGIKRVEALAAKHAFVCEIIQSWNPPNPVRFYVPEDNAPEAKPSCALVQVTSLPPLDHDPHRSLHELTLNALRVPLQQLHSPPPANAPFEDRVNFWAEHTVWDKEAANRYYREHIFKEEAAKMRESLTTPVPAGLLLATICEYGSYDKLDMLTEVLQLPRGDVVLFYSGKRPDPPGVQHCFELPQEEITDPKALARFVRESLDGLPQHGGHGARYIFDLTAGTKPMSVGLYLAARPGDYWSVLASPQLDNYVQAARRHRPGKQQLFVRPCEIPDGLENHRA